MLNKITRTLKPYLPLVLCLAMLLGTWFWAQTGPEEQEPTDIEIAQVAPDTEKTSATEAAATPASTTDQPTSEEAAASDRGQQPAPASVPKAKTPSNSAQRGTSERPKTKTDTAASASAKQQDLNTYVLNAIKTYANGKFPYLLDNNYTVYNGVTSNIYYQGKLLLKAHPSGNRASHCVGITFEVFFKAMQARNKAAGLAAANFNGMSYSEMTDFMLTWFVAQGAKDQSNLAVAIEKYGLGKRITDLSDAKAGDFIDFSRTNGTGHAVVLINWIKRDGKIIGLRYWSSQESTGGIAYAEEYFNVLRPDGTPYGSIRRDRIYIGRVGPINAYR